MTDNGHSLLFNRRPNGPRTARRRKGDTSDADNNTSRSRHPSIDLCKYTRWHSWKSSVYWTRWHHKWSGPRRGCTRTVPARRPRIDQRAVARRGHSGVVFAVFASSHRRTSSVVRKASTASLKFSISGDERRPMRAVTSSGDEPQSRDCAPTAASPGSDPRDRPPSATPRSGGARHLHRQRVLLTPLPLQFLLQMRNAPARFPLERRTAAGLR